jgi:Lon protease-like protein
MALTPIELPLFPLNVVLFPGTVLPLHIFETRYRQMVADCQRDNKPFGVVLLKPESKHLREVPHAIGTMAEIRNVDRLKDGRYNLIAIGTQRFRIIHQHHHKPYLSASIELYEDEVEPEDELIGSLAQARNLFEAYLEILLKAGDESDVQANLPDGAEALSHFIAYILDIQDEQKQYFLELTSTRQRLQEEIGILRREVPFMRQILSKKLPDDRTRLN